jgi:hypothetical protein
VVVVFGFSNTTQSQSIKTPPSLPPSLPPSFLISAYLILFVLSHVIYLGIVKRGTEEEVAVRLLKAREDREPKVLPGLMALQRREEGREGRKGVSICVKMRGKIYICKKRWRCGW